MAKKISAKVKKPEKVDPEVVMVRCPDCPWKAGLLDANTFCPTCEGHGVVEAKE